MKSRVVKYSIIFLIFYLGRGPLLAQTPWQQDSIAFYKKWWEFAEIEKSGKISDQSLAIKQEGMALSKKLLAEKFDPDIYCMHVSHYFGISIDLLALGDAEGSLTYSDSAIQLLIARFGPTYIGLQNYYIQRGGIFCEIQDYDKALDLNKKMLQLLEQNQADSVYLFDFDVLKFRWMPNNRQRNLAKYHFNVAKIYEDMGKLELAARHNQAFLEIANALNIPIGARIGSLDRSGILYLALGEYEKALEVFTEIEQLVAENMAQYLLPKLYARLRLAGACMYLGRDSLAEIWLEGVFPLPEPATIRDRQHSTLIFCLQTLGEACLSRQLYGQARRYFDEAWELSNHFHGPANDWSLNIRNNTADAWIGMGQPDSALAVAAANFEAITQGMDIRDPDADPAHYPLAVGFILPTTLGQYGKALALRFEQSGERTELEQALPYYQLAANIVDAIRRNYFSEGSKQILIARAIELYEGAVQTALKLHEVTSDAQYLETAFAFAEKSKSVLLLESVQGAKAQKFSGMPQVLLEREKDLKIDIAYYSKQLYDEQNKKKPDTAKIERWEARALALRNEYDSLLTVFKNQYPDYYALKYDIQYASVAEIRDYLPDAHTACIEYFWGKDNLYAFVITKAGVRCIQKPLTDDLDQRLQRFNYLLSHPDDSPVSDYAEHAGYLYDYLLRDALAGADIEHLVIIPDGRLGYLPFQVLIDNRQLEGVDDYRKLPYVINNYEVRYEYSSTLLLAEYSPGQQKGGFLGFAPQYGEGSQGVSVRSTSTGDWDESAESMQLLPLQFTQTEVQQINRLFAGEAYTGITATEAAFKTEAPKHNILHLAMHAHTSDENPMYSRLVFQQGDTAGIEDGLLYAYELYNMSLKADLAVLSACQTGTGQLQHGEGIMSLSRAFKYAGCPNIVMSLWQADDASTKDIMVGFYENLKKGVGKSDALRRAERAYLQSAPSGKTHPYYWATFVLAGDGKPVAW